jgi:uncharacterized membrane protein YqgA involved in biofilm formation
MWQWVAVKLPIVFLCIFALKINNFNSMFGTIVNTLAVIVGGFLGVFLHKSFQPRFKEMYFQATGLFTLAIGIVMMKDMQHIIVASIALGSLIGEWLNIENAVERMGNALKTKLKIGNDRFSEGLVTSFMLFCVGAMTIVGAIDEGVGRSSEVLLTKSMMDGFSALLLASALGIGVVFSAIPLFIFQGGISLLAMYAAGFFNETIINGLSSVGGILLIGLSINILGLKKLRIINMLPSLVLVVCILWLSSKLGLI